MIVLSQVAPVVTPPVPDQQAASVDRLTATWTSWTGESWTLTDQSSPVYVLQGADGFDMVDPEHWWGDDDSGRDGSDWDGMRFPRGEVVLPIRVGGDTTEEFLANRKAFRRSLDPRQVGLLKLTTPDGQSRQIACRYESGGKAPIEQDPVMVRRASYVITWATADPFWRGDAVSGFFPYAPPQQFYGVWPPVVNSSQSLGFATVTNLGEVDAAPLVHVGGPFTGFEVGVGTGTVAMTLTKAAGQWVEVNAKSGQLSMVDETGARVWSYATKANLRGMAIPPGEDVQLTTKVDGAATGSAVTVTFEPGYLDAY